MAQAEKAFFRNCTDLIDVILLVNSLFNGTEIAEVVNYVKKLLYPSSETSNMPLIRGTDIGVISPYKKQCRKIAQRFRELGLSGISVGTTEIFQGKEKPVMIVSTVRSGGSGLGFVSERRVIIILFDLHTSTSIGILKKIFSFFFISSDLM